MQVLKGLAIFFFYAGFDGANKNLADLSAERGKDGLKMAKGQEQNVTNETAENVMNEAAVETVTEETEVAAVTNGRAVSGFKVRREKFKADDGREMWSYFLNGKVRGRDVKVSFVAYDKGGAGYEFLDIIFSGKETADLVMYDEAKKDFNGKVISRNTVYEIQDVDEVTGVVYSYRVKPYRETDKAYIKIMLAEQAAKNRGAKK